MAATLEEVIHKQEEQIMLQEKTIHAMKETIEYLKESLSEADRRAECLQRTVDAYRKTDVLLKETQQAERQE